MGGIQRMNKKLVVLGLFLILLLSTIPISTYGNETNSQQIERIDFLMKLLMRISKVPSVSACIIQEDTIIWSDAYGYFDIENKKHATCNTLYNIASISKTVTATALMQLYEQNRINLDDDINEYLPFDVNHPDYPDISITFRMLLSHQSGLSEDPEEFYLYFPPEQCHIPLYPWIETYLSPDGENYTSKIWSDDAPGETFHYANVGFALIGYLVEIIANQPFYQYCDENIFIPLKMYNTSYILSDVNLSNLAIPYHYKFPNYIPYGHTCYIGYPCGSIQTSVIELSHFIIAHMNNGEYDGYQLLNASSIDIMHTIQYQDGDYGLGWSIWDNSNNEHFYGHTGGDYGVATSVSVRTNDNTAVIYFTNGEPIRPLQFIAWDLFENVLFLYIL
jgi:CubicO group peptidase (beta-lactamase class C family)